MPESEPRVQVMVVGASAGGLEALTSLLAATRPGLGWCFVIAQHMLPSGPSGIAELLDGVTELDVVEATHGDIWRGDTVFVAPPGRNIAVEAGAIAVEDPGTDIRPWPSIDRLFVSAARAMGDRAVAIVLSGTGDDGAAGVEAIEAAGGVVVVQELHSAAFEAMPSASFATGSVDIQASASDIPGQLEKFLESSSAIRLDRLTAGTQTPTPDESALLDDVIAILHDNAGIDFLGYKTSTLQRQMARRQRSLDMNSVDGYVKYLRDSPEEADALSRSLLVTVTAFFRDTDVWEGLRTHLADAIAGSESDQFRIWVPGCASGEEVYTIAMLAAEALGKSHDDLSGRLKIFATDLDERALDVARSGRYSTRAAESIPDRLRHVWTRSAEDGIEIVPSLRESIVFARHNVAFDPPFPNLDVISLRNTMIYFQPRLQERVLQLCQFALVPNGLLLLGQSERVPRADEMFVVVDNEHRLYRRRQHSRLMGLPLGRMSASSRSTPRANSLEIRTRGSADSHFYLDIVRAVSPAALILDSRSVLIEVIGDVSEWCTVGEGAHSGHVVNLLKDEYRSSVRAMLSQLRHSAPDTTSRRISTELGTTRITVARIDSAVGVSSRASAGAIVTFDAGPSSDRSARILPAVDDGTAAQASAELESVYEALQATVEDLSSSNEELQALNEELQASSEELQAASEEVQASNEELEATNEELTTLNQELASRGTELVRANIDLENIQSSMTSGLVLLDRDLRVTRYSPLAVRLFSLIPSDIGRPLTAVPTTIPVPELSDALDRTLAGEARIIELDSDERDLLVQTQPYRGDKKEILGAIVVVIDVSDITAERRSRERALANLEIVTESVAAVVWQRDSSGTLTLLTRRVEDLFGLDRARVLADPSLLLSAVHPDDRDRVASISASAEPNWRMRYRIVTPNGDVRWIEETAALARPSDGFGAVRVGSAVDVTEEQGLASAVEAQSSLLTAIFGSESLGILVVDEDKRIIQVGDAIEIMTGYDSAALLGRAVSSLIVASSVDDAGEVVSNRRMLCSDGHDIPVAVEYLAGDRTPSGTTIVVVHDSSRLRRLSADLAAHEQFDQQTGLLTRTFFRHAAHESVTAGKDRAAVLWIDLDGFKEVNDRLGHRSGDVVLGVIAARLKRATREHHLVGRLGGDEFAVLITRVEDLDSLDSLIHRILTAIREPVVIDDSLAFVSGSIGVAVQPDDGVTADALLHNADVAMYAAKKNGRDQHVYFTAEMDRDADNRAAMRHQLAEAVRHHDFELHYQPIRDVGTGEIAMVEALIRWRRDGELVVAGEFIDLAADTGQLRALGNLALDSLMRDVDTMFTRLGADHPRVAVNLSATELRERDVTDRLMAWHPAGGFDKLVIEVTEQTTLAPGDRAFETLALLRRLGATISIDDFGTGYSNLELLGLLKPGIIKIDRSLTESAAAGERGARILDAAVVLAHALGAIVVVEGVGTAELQEVASRTGTDLMQGFHLGRPEPVDAVIDTITAGRQVDLSASSEQAHLREQ